MKLFTASLSLSLLLFAINYDLLASVNSFKLDLIHRDALSGAGDDCRQHYSGRRISTEEKIRSLHARDLERSRRRRAAETGWSGASAAMQLHSGADYGTGEYFVHVRVGSPGQKFMLVADTGSDLTWINCRYGCSGGRRRCGTHKGRLEGSGKRVFLADRSSTFTTIPCLSDMCKLDLANLFSLATCPTPLTPCAYDYSYLEGSSAIGFFANETVTVNLTNGRKTRLKNVLIGCTESTRGAEQGGFKEADGVLGLGFGTHSFTAKAARDFGGKFSYCLVDHLSPKNVSNYLIFGQHGVETSLTSAMQHTELVVGDVFGPLYGVSVSGISIGAKVLDIPPQVWEPGVGGGTILDSGTSLTFLAEPAYGPVTAELNKYTSRLEQLATNDGGPFEYCFNLTGYDESAVPRLRVHFEGGAVFEPPVKSYIIDVAPQKKCLGFVSASWPGTSIIGNIMQQNHLWEFYLDQRKLGFAPSSCT